MNVVCELNPSDVRTGRRIVLGLAATVVMVACSLHLEGTGKVQFGGVNLPTLCAFKALCGMPCPGCGLTRSFVATAHFDLARGFAFHPLGPLLFLLVLAQLPWQAIRLARGCRSATIGLAGPGPETRSERAGTGCEDLTDFGGVRPSTAAATSEISAASGWTKSLAVAFVSAPEDGRAPVWWRLRSALLLEVLAIALVLVGLGRIWVALASGSGPREPDLALGSWPWALAILVLAGAVRLACGFVSARKSELNSFLRGL